MVAEEHKLLAGIFVRAYGLVLYALAVEFADSCRKVVHLESKVTQTGCFYLSILLVLFVQDIGKALSPISTDAITIDVATLVIGYRLLLSALILAIIRCYDSSPKMVRTAFSEYPHEILATMFCLIRLKKTSISHL